MAVKKRKILMWIVLALVAAGLLLVGILVASDAPVPKGSAGAKAEAMTDKMFAAINERAWEETGAVRWRLADGRPLHLWDRQRDLAAVHYDSEDPKVMVLMNLATRQTIATAGSDAIEGEDLEAWKEKAYGDFVNDSFWLNVPAKARDTGTQRAHVKRFDDKPLPNDGGLLISYASGGVTPGDAYLWEFDANGVPVAWRMWVRIIPVGGVRVTWEEWTTLPTGAKVARSHNGPMGLKLRLDPLDAATTLPELVKGADPFKPLFVKAPPPKAQPATRPATPPVEPKAPAAAPTDAGTKAPVVDGGPAAP